MATLLTYVYRCFIFGATCSLGFFKDQQPTKTITMSTTKKYWSIELFPHRCGNFVSLRWWCDLILHNLSIHPSMHACLRMSACVQVKRSNTRCLQRSPTVSLYTISQATSITTWKMGENKLVALNVIELRGDDELVNCQPHPAPTRPCIHRLPSPNSHKLEKPVH